MAGKQDRFTLSVLSESDVIYYGECRLLFVPGLSETLAIMPFHTPMISLLGKGEIIAKEDTTQHLITSIEKGILYVGENEVSVLVNL
jgi:F0F1-type ATP synthase epsilon subunit